MKRQLIAKTLCVIEPNCGEDFRDWLQGQLAMIKSYEDQGYCKFTVSTVGYGDSWNELIGERPETDAELSARVARMKKKRKRSSRSLRKS